MIEPQTPEQWRDAVTYAEALLAFDSATQYGLITGGPVINVERCVEILRMGKSIGVVPRRTDVDECIAQLVAELNGGPTC